MIVSANGKTTVPIVSGTLETEAEAKIKDADLVVGDIKYQSSDKIDRHRVISSSPKESSKVKKGTKVSLVVSSGPRLVRVGNYVGQEYDVVKQKLEDEGFTVHKRNAPSSSFGSGRILQQDFESGKRFNPATKTLTFVVSTGVKRITLKDLTGMTKAQVVSYSNKVEINPTFDYVYSDDQPKGRVVRQSPNANESIQQGGNVAVWISRGPKKDSSDELKSFNVKITIPYLDNNSAASSDSTLNESGISSDDASTESTSGSNENVVLIYLKDHDHSLSTVYKQMVITKDTQVTLPFKLSGSEVGQYKVVRDGRTIMRDNNVTYNSH